MNILKILDNIYDSQNNKHKHFTHKHHRIILAQDIRDYSELNFTDKISLHKLIDFLNSKKNYIEDAGLTATEFGEFLQKFVDIGQDLTQLDDNPVTCQACRKVWPKDLMTIYYKVPTDYYGIHWNNGMDRINVCPECILSKSTHWADGDDDLYITVCEKCGKPTSSWYAFNINGENLCANCAEMDEDKFADEYSDEDDDDERYSAVGEDGQEVKEYAKDKIKHYVDIVLDSLKSNSILPNINVDYGQNAENINSLEQLKKHCRNKILFQLDKFSMAIANIQGLNFREYQDEILREISDVEDDNTKDILIILPIINPSEELNLENIKKLFAQTVKSERIKKKDTNDTFTINTDKGPKEVTINLKLEDVFIDVDEEAISLVFKNVIKMRKKYTRKKN